MANILIVDESPRLMATLSEGEQGLCAQGHGITWVKAYEWALDQIRESRPEVVLFDLDYPRDPARWDLLRQIKRLKSRPRIIVLSAYQALLDDPRGAAADGAVIKGMGMDSIKGKIRELLSGPSCAPSLGPQAGENP